MSTPRQLPIDAQTFEYIRKAGAVYVDKTQYIEKLLSLGRFFFLSRPHRFGKSLFTSTLKAYFEGKKELFDGLYLEHAEPLLAEQMRREAWASSPVLYFQLNGVDYSYDEALSKTLVAQMRTLEAQWGIEGAEEETSPDIRFTYLIQTLFQKTKQQVVVLIDEYDKPLLETFDAPERNERFRTQLKSFYEVLKKSDAYIRFVFLTGITKFSKIVLFSGLNNLKDITLLDSYAAICGFTQEELTGLFMPEIEALATKYQKSTEETLVLLKKKYDGYRFAGGGEQVYNPYSLLNVLADSLFRYYWFETATPAFLVKYLQRINYYIPEIKDGVEIDEGALQDFRIGAANPLPLLFQSGYLTIKDYDFEENIYTLRFPNEEVKYGFLRTLLMGYYPTVLDAVVDVRRFREEILRGDVDAFMQRLSAIISGIPYGDFSRAPEPYYERDGQVAVFLLFLLMGQFIQTEVHNHVGRADAVVHTPEIIYVFEFKLDGSGTPEEALQQIEAKGYALPYQGGDKQVVCVGVAFSKEKKTIASWLVKR
ncbi:MAG: AAA family ATPase [Bacteroides sp.]